MQARPNNMARGRSVRGDKSAPAFADALLFLLAVLARGIARIALELLLVFETLLLRAAGRLGGLALDLRKTQRLLTGGLFGG